MASAHTHNGGAVITYRFEQYFGLNAYFLFEYAYKSAGKNTGFEFLFPSVARQLLEVGAKFYAKRYFGYQFRYNRHLRL